MFHHRPGASVNKCATSYVSSGEERHDQHPPSRARTEIGNLIVAEINALRRAALRHTRDPEAAADLVQETVLRALRAEARFDLRPIGVRPWLLTILRNAFYGEQGRRRRHRFVPLGDDAPVEARRREVSDEGAVDWEQVDGRVARAVRQLPERQREVLLLSAVEGQTYAAMAEALGVPPGTVMSRLHRARGALARELADVAGEAGVRPGHRTSVARIFSSPVE